MKSILDILYLVCPKDILVRDAQQQKKVEDKDISHFPKIYVTPLHFCERPTLVLIFITQKKSERDFHFKKKEGKNSIQCLFCCCEPSGDSMHLEQWKRHCFYYVSVIVGLLCYLIWFGRLFFGFGNAQKFSI